MKLRVTVRTWPSSGQLPVTSKTPLWDVLGDRTYRHLFLVQVVALLAFQATLPDVLLDEGRYTSALSLSRLAYDLENIISPILAALLLMIVSSNVLFFGTLAGFVASAALVLSVILPSPLPSAKRGIYERTTRGIRIYIKTPRLRGLLALNLAAAAAGAMVIVNTVVLIRANLGLGENEVAITLGLFGAGSMLAAFALPTLLHRFSDRSLMLWGATVMTAAGRHICNKGSTPPLRMTRTLMTIHERFGTSCEKSFRARCSECRCPLRRFRVADHSLRAVIGGIGRLCAPFAIAILALTMLSPVAFAHGVDDDTRIFLENNTGVQFVPFLYIGAKHMVTGYDHLLFLLGVLFFLYRSRDVLLYVTMFTVGHSVTLLLGVLGDIQANAWLIDAIIGLSVVYKGFDNLGGFQRLLGRQPDTRLAVLVFGLFHGFGLATKLQEFGLPEEGLLTNLIAFNLGVELGQFSALIVILLMLNLLRKLPSFDRLSIQTNTLLMSAGLMLVGYQLTGYALNL